MTATNELDAYDKFVERLKTNYPKSFRNVYCGISISEGWFHIIENLCANAYSHVKWKREMRARELLQNRARARGREAVEKFVTKGRQPSLYDETRIEEILDNDPIEVTPHIRHIEVHQIKEKFGGLRFYYEGGDGEVSGMVRMAECWAAYTCEVCGERGTRRAGGWIRTLCDKHEAEHQQRLSEDRAQYDD